MPQLLHRMSALSTQARYNSTRAPRAGAAPVDTTPITSTVPPRSTHASYHPKGYGVSEGLKRARKPYRMRNAVTGVIIMGFAASVYFYSISKVRTDRCLGVVTTLLTLLSTPNRSSRMTFLTWPISVLRRKMHRRQSPLRLTINTKCKSKKYQTFCVSADSSRDQ